MTVGKLIEKLKNISPDTIIVMSSDGEGNSYSPLAGLNTGDYKYVAESTWSGWLCNQQEQLEEQDEEDGYTLEDMCTEGVACVVLWPTN